MITNFKIFENVVLWPIGYMIGKDQFFINDIMEYLGVDVDIITMDESTELESPYHVNVIDFMKEILLDKTIIFECKDAIMKDPTLKGEVENVGTFSYKNDFIIKVKLKNPQIMLNNKFIDYKDLRTDDDWWFLIKNNTIVSIYDYDTDTKPLHKLVELKKKAEKFNI